LIKAAQAQGALVQGQDQELAVGVQAVQAVLAVQAVVQAVVQAEAGPRQEQEQEQAALRRQLWSMVNQAPIQRRRWLPSLALVPPTVDRWRALMTGRMPRSARCLQGRRRGFRSRSAASATT
jgi:hypothetical protein